MGFFVGQNTPVTIWYFETTTLSGSAQTVVTKEQANCSYTNAGWPFVFYKNTEHFGEVKWVQTEFKLPLALMNLVLLVTSTVLMLVAVKMYHTYIRKNRQRTPGGFP